MRKTKIKRIAVVASGWHFPSHFYEYMVQQILPRGWEFDLFCVAHRDTLYARLEKKNDKFDTSTRGLLDAKLYSRVISKEDIEKLGWKYIEEPNTIGDWGNTNQWLEKNDYKKYDLFLFTHDDNLFLTQRLFKDIIGDGSFKQWDILCNSLGMPKGSIRGSCEFFKPKVLDLMGGKFDLSDTTLDKTGEVVGSKDLMDLYNWNNNTLPLNRLIEQHKLKIGFLSPSYRVSAFCIEGERGYISATHGQNTAVEEEGFEFLKKAQLI